MFQVAAADAARATRLLGADAGGCTVAAALARAANDALDADGAGDSGRPGELPRAVLQLLGHVAFFDAAGAWPELLGARTDVLAAHDVAALCERLSFAAPARDRRDADAVLAKLRSDGLLR